MFPTATGLLLVGAALLGAGPAVQAAPPAQPQGDGPRAFLLTTFTDPDPSIFQYLSEGSSPYKFSPLNGGKPVLRSNVGTRGVRDPFLVANKDRTEFFLLATDLDIRHTTFADSVRTGSRKLIVWKSADLVSWHGPQTAEVEGPDFGMAWAPSAIARPDGAGYDVFWATRQFAGTDRAHATRGPANKIRTARTRDFATFSDTRDYAARPGTGLIDQEFVQLRGTGADGDHWLRFLKNETDNRVFTEISTTGLFGDWRPVGEIASREAREGTAAYWDLDRPDTLHVLLDNYKQYDAWTGSGDLTKPGAFTEVPNSGLPGGLRHGNVFPITQKEHDRIKSALGRK